MAVARKRSRPGDIDAAGPRDAPGGADFDVSGFVRRVRRLADLSQRDLAREIGVDQSTVSRLENGAGADLRTFLGILALAGFALRVVDADDEDVTPMPADVFRDRAGRRRPAHLDVHARPEQPTTRMLLHTAVPVSGAGAWHHLRPERDRIRAVRGRCARDEQLTVAVAAEAMTAAAAARRNGHRHRAARAGPRGTRTWTPPLG